MLTPSAFRFLRSLQKNNRREWFEANRTHYQQGRDEFMELARVLLEGLSEADPAFAGQQARDCLFRLHRDARFARNRDPYKTHWSAYFCRNGRKGPGAGYYLHAEPGGSFLAAGVWMPEGSLLAGLRQELDYAPDEWLAILRKPALRRHFPGGLDDSQRLVRMPKGYPEDHPLAQDLKRKSFVVRKALSEADCCGTGAAARILTAFRAATPLVDFLNRPLE